MKEINQQVNLTYIIATLFGESCQVTENSLKSCGATLDFQNKQLLNMLKKDVNHVQYLIKRLHEASIFSHEADEDAADSHDEAVGIYYSLFMAMVEVIGTDKNHRLRAYYLFKVLRKFKRLIKFANADIRVEYAFTALEREIHSNKYTIDELKNVLLEDESDNTTPEN